MTTVKDLKLALESMPDDAEVFSIYDGFCKIELDLVYLAKGGHVVLIQNGDTVYHDKDRPEWAPLEKDDSSWDAVGPVA